MTMVRVRLPTFPIRILSLMMCRMGVMGVMWVMRGEAVVIVVRRLFPLPMRGVMMMREVGGVQMRVSGRLLTRANDGLSRRRKGSL